MSWSYSATGRGAKLAEIVKQQITDTRGAVPNSAEEAAKNQVGDVIETLCKSLAAEKVVIIRASGSAWFENGVAQAQSLELKFETLGNFVE